MQPWTLRRQAGRASTLSSPKRMSLGGQGDVTPGAGLNAVMVILKNIVTSLLAALPLTFISLNTPMNYLTGCSFSDQRTTMAEWFLSVFMAIFASTSAATKNQPLRPIFVLYASYILNGFAAYLMREYLRTDLAHFLLFTTYVLASCVFIGRTSRKTA